MTQAANVLKSPFLGWLLLVGLLVGWVVSLLQSVTLLVGCLSVGLTQDARHLLQGVQKHVPTSTTSGPKMVRRCTNVGMQILQKYLGLFL